MRWARISVCAMAMAMTLLAATAPSLAAGRAGAAAAGGRGGGTTVTAAARAGTGATASPAAGPTLSLTAQTSWVSPDAPWFALTAAVGSRTGPIGDLHVELTLYNRISNPSQLAQATNAAVPDNGVIDHFDAPVTPTPTGRVAATCATVLRQESEVPPTTAPPNTVACPAGSQT